jgi:hypothetical protein
MFFTISCACHELHMSDVASLLSDVRSEVCVWVLNWEYLEARVIWCVMWLCMGYVKVCRMGFCWLMWNWMVIFCESCEFNLRQESFSELCATLWIMSWLYSCFLYVVLLEYCFFVCWYIPVDKTCHFGKWQTLKGSPWSGPSLRGGWNWYLPDIYSCIIYLGCEEWMGGQTNHLGW